MFVSASTSYDPIELRQREVVTMRWFYIAVLAVVGAALCVPFILGGDYYLSIFTDDLFYYLKIAENVAAGKGTTFNEIATTNGYQPLWQLLIVGLQILANFLHLNVISLIVVAIFLFFVAYARLLDLTIREKYSPAYFPLVALNLIFFLQAALSGMEIIVLMPLVLMYFSEFRGPESEWNHYKIGFYASLVVLARLDAVFLVFIHVLYLFANKNIKVIDLIKMSLGGVLFPLYLLGNHWFYGTWMPISGIVKGVSELQPILHKATFTSLFQYGAETSLLNAGIIVVWLCIGLGLIFKKIKLEGYLYHSLWASCLFLPVFFLITSMRSDWPLWRWYFYPLYVFFVYASAYICRVGKINELRIPVGLIAGGAFAVVLALSSMIAWKLAHKNDRHLEALQIRAFVKEHPGIYAMGDRAGLPAYITDVPFVQLEGLVMDKQYLDSLKEAASIDALLKRYNVKYYISGSVKGLGSEGCFEAREPSQSKGFSVQLVSSFCWPIEKILKSAKNGSDIYVFRNPNT